jgi:hypothetical protein
MNKSYNSNKTNYVDSSSDHDRSSPKGSSPIATVTVAASVKPIKFTKSVYTPKKGKTDESYIFEMKKTENIEVYHLNIVEPIQDGSVTRLKRIKIGLAFIPNVSRSKWCRDIFEETLTEGKVLVHCKYHDDKYKWEPILLSDAKRPSLTDEFFVKQINE